MQIHSKGQSEWKPAKCFPRFSGQVLKSVTKIPDLQLCSKGLKLYLELLVNLALPTWNARVEVSYYMAVCTNCLIKPLDFLCGHPGVLCLKL